MVREDSIFVNGIRFHYLEGGLSNHPGTPAVYVPGFLADAEWFRRDMENLEPRRTISISMRGRGESDAPPTGYSFEDHVADLEAVTKELSIPQFCLIAFSRGVSYSLGFALNNLDLMKGFILQDSDPVYSRLTEEWINQAREQMQQIPDHVVQAIYRESADIDLWERLPEIKCPVMVMRGSESSLSREDAQRYLELLPQAEVVVIEDAGHLLWEPNYEQFFEHIRRFLGSLDEKGEG